MFECGSNRPRRIGVVVLFLLIACIGCDGENVESNSGTGPSAEPTSSDGGNNGPLATVDLEGSGASEASSGEGTLVISTECVHLELPSGARTLLVWRAHDASWSGADSTILFNGQGETISLRNGARVKFGGESLEEDGASSPRDIPWAVRPHPGCEGNLFLVDNAVLLDG
jgi:hypothetical protein